MVVYLVELKKLAFLLGRMSDRVLAWAFVHRLPGNIRQTLSVSSRMDMLSIDQLLSQPMVIMRDREMEDVAVVVVARPMQSMESDA